MRTLIVTAFVSADGVMEAPGGGELPQRRLDVQGRRVRSGRLRDQGPRAGGDHRPAVRPADATRSSRRCGRRWRSSPSTTRCLATSSRPPSPPTTPRWPATVLRSLDDVAALKETDGGPIAVHGSATLGASLADAGLVDRYHLLVFPVLLGAGKRLFSQTRQGHDQAESRRVRGVPQRDPEAGLRRRALIGVRGSPRRRGRAGGSVRIGAIGVLIRVVDRDAPAGTASGPDGGDEHVAELRHGETSRLVVDIGKSLGTELERVQHVEVHVQPPAVIDSSHVVHGVLCGRGRIVGNLVDGAQPNSVIAQRADVELLTPALVAGPEHRQPGPVQSREPRCQSPSEQSSRQTQEQPDLGVRRFAVFGDVQRHRVLVAVDEQRPIRPNRSRSPHTVPSSDEQSPPKTTGNRPSTTARPTRSPNSSVMASSAGSLINVVAAPVPT